MEQITCLLFLRRLDDLHSLEENKSVRLGKPGNHLSEIEKKLDCCTGSLDSHGL
jgi:hypothetical protein